MTLQQVAIKYRISENALGSKEDGLKVAAKSIDDIINQMRLKDNNPESIQKLLRLKDFLIDVKNTSF